MDLSISPGAPPAPPAGAARPTAPALVRGLLPHLVWELVLLLLVLAAGIALAAKNDRVFSAGGLWGQLAIAGLFTAALALSFRTATPNLAVTTIGTVSGWWYVHLHNDGGSAVLAWLVPIVASLAIGLVLGVIVGLTPLPGWAVSLVATAIVGGAVQIGENAGQTVALRDGRTGTGTFVAWLVFFAVASVAGAVVLAIPSVRAAVSRNRLEPGADAPRLGAKLFGALIGLGGSSVIAAVAGIVYTQRLQAVSAFTSYSLAFVLGTVLLAGVSPLGRRAGLLGVVLAVTLAVFVQTWLSLDGAGYGAQTVTLGVLGLLGLAVIAVLEWIGGWQERSRAVTGAPPPPMYGPGQPFAPPLPPS